MFEGIRAFFAARRMKLRDKGKTKKKFLEGDAFVNWYVHSACVRCYTLLRIGITENGRAVMFCWKCEIIYGQDPPTPPKSKEPIPKEKKVIEAKSNVIHFPNKKAA